MRPLQTRIYNLSNLYWFRIIAIVFRERASLHTFGPLAEVQTNNRPGRWVTIRLRLALPDRMPGRVLPLRESVRSSLGQFDFNTPDYKRSKLRKKHAVDSARLPHDVIDHIADHHIPERWSIYRAGFPSRWCSSMRYVWRRWQHDGQALSFSWLGGYEANQPKCLYMDPGVCIRIRKPIKLPDSTPGES